MTEQELLNIDLTTAEGKQELSRVAGEVLEGGGPYWHDHYYSSETHNWTCRKCKQSHPILDMINGKYCKVPPKLTWQEAMKWRDWAVEKFGQGDFYLAMYNVWESTGRLGKFAVWLVSPHCQPEHYILAAVLCVIRGKA